jgi:hypothetical protein
MQKPHAMNITKNPDIKNSNEFRMKTLCAGASCAKAGLAIKLAAPARHEYFKLVLIIGNSYVMPLKGAIASFVGTNPNRFLKIESENLAIANFAA